MGFESTGSAAGRGGMIIGLVALLLAGAAGAGHHEKGEHMGHGSEEARVVQVVTTLVGGKNVFIPSTIVLTEGKPHTLSIFNTTDKPHGFAIEPLKVMEVLPDQVEHEVKLPALEAGIYPIHCQLHPAHRTAIVDSQAKVFGGCARDCHHGSSGVDNKILIGITV